VSDPGLVDTVSVMHGSADNSAVGYRWHAFAGVTAVVLASSCLCFASQLRAENVPVRASADRSGEFRVTEGMTLHLNVDLGCVKVQTLPGGKAPVVQYSVHIETDAANPVGQRLLDAYSLTTRESADTVFLSGVLPNLSTIHVRRRLGARNAQFWVQFVVSVPATFNLDVSTGAGDIETSDVNGRVVLLTQGGNISTGRISLANSAPNRGDRLAARIETQGGHITLKDVSGDVDAYTAGGHIQAGSIDGNARLRTGGGHIRAARIKGTANLETDGGNIAVGEAGSYVGVRTGGGQIDFGEVHGSVRAQTGGGGIRIMYVSGPMEVASSGGSICLTRVANTVRAETSEGTITAWISPDAPERTHRVRLPGPSQLTSRTGDLVVFLPRNISMTIDATVENGGPGRIEADSSLALNVQSHPEGSVHAIGTLNGGGAILKLRTTAGKIQLQYLDAQASLRQSLLEEQKQRLAEKLNEFGMTTVAFQPWPPLPANAPAMPSLDEKDDWFENAMNHLQFMFMGSIHEDGLDFRKRLNCTPLPEYPALARRAGIQGMVVLQVRLKPDGSLNVEKIVSGQPVLADAAIAAVRKWRGTPGQMAGKNVEVVSTVSLNFELQH
jgi:TonB family protein